MALDMVYSDASYIYTESFGSFYPAATNNTSRTSSARTLAIHKEKFNVLLSGNKHKDLSNFERYSKTFTGLAEITKSKGLRTPRSQLPESKMLAVALRTQDAWKYEFDTLIRENGRLQGTSTYVRSCNIKYM